MTISIDIQIVNLMSSCLQKGHIQIQQHVTFLKLGGGEGANTFV